MLTAPFAAMMPSMVNPNTGSLNVAVAGTGELGLTGVPELAATDTRGAWLTVRTEPPRTCFLSLSASMVQPWKPCGPSALAAVTVYVKVSTPKRLKLTSRSVNLTEVSGNLLDR